MAPGGAVRSWPDPPVSGGGAGHRLRSHERVELGAVEIAKGESGGAKRRGLLVCLLGDLGSLVIPDPGCQGRHEHQRVRHVLVDPCPVRLEALDAVLAEAAAGVGEQLVRVEQVEGDDLPSGVGQEVSQPRLVPGPVFSPGEVSKTVTVHVKPNRVYEPTKTFSVGLANPVNAIIAKGRGTGTILNDDPLPTLSINDVQVKKSTSGTSDAVFTISLNGATAVPVSVHYVTADGTAASPSDYAAIPLTTLSFAPRVRGVNHGGRERRHRGRGR